MTTTWVLMTALPPTRGHLDIINYADSLDNNLTVVLNTQPDEPFTGERYVVLHSVFPRSGYRKSRWIQTSLITYSKPIQQVPKSDKDEAFWDMWRDILRNKGLRKDDIIVASDDYGKKLAEVCECTFMPYDLERTTRPGSATDVREDPIGNFSYILPSFQKYLRKTVTIFGAESTGKSTLSADLSASLNGLHLTEWARPYLELMGPTVTTEKMHAIHKGQAALQRSVGRSSENHPFIIQDTDLFSTLGYWHMWDELPDLDLMEDAVNLKSDLYIICPSNIPFEKDPLRYGGDKRESEDDYWIKLCEIFDLNYIVLTEKSRTKRKAEAEAAMIELFNADQLKYKRVK